MIGFISFNQDMIDANVFMLFSRKMFSTLPLIFDKIFPNLRFFEGFAEALLDPVSTN